VHCHRNPVTVIPLGDGNERAGYITEVNGVVGYGDLSVGRFSSKSGNYETVIPTPENLASFVGIFHIHPNDSNEYYGPSDLDAAYSASVQANKQVRGYIGGTRGNLAVIDNPQNTLFSKYMKDSSTLSSDKFRIIQSNGYFRSYNGS
jgi:hypothetical protein